MYSAGEKKRLLYLKKKTAEFRCSRPEAFVGKDVLEICSKITGKHSCRSVISINLQSNFIEITLRHGCSAVNLLHIFRTPFPKIKTYFNERNTTFKELITTDKYVTLHHRILLVVVTELFKFKKDISIITIGDTFWRRSCLSTAM